MTDTQPQTHTDDTHTGAEDSGLTHERAGGRPDLTRAEAEALLPRRGGQAAPTVDRPAGEARGLRGAARDRALQALTVRPVLHDALNLEPAAWAAVLDAVDLAQVAADETLTVASRYQGAVKAATERVRAGGKVGKVPTEAAMQARASGEALAASDRARAARQEYDAAVAALQLDQAAELQRLIGEAGPAAVAALRQAQRAFAALTEVVGLLRKTPTPGYTAKPLPGAFYKHGDPVGALASALAEVDWSDVLERELPVFSRSERERIVQASRHYVGGWTADMVELSRQERAENYAHTAHTRGAGSPPPGMLDGRAAVDRFLV